jgi:hypothetical protein
MAITDLDSLVSALAGAAGAPAQPLNVNKASIANAQAGAYHSLWRATGLPGQGAIPGAAAVCTRTLAGALNQAALGGGRKQYLGRAYFLSANSATNVYVWDRLAHMAGLSGASASPQTVNVDVSGTGDNMVERRGRSDYSQVDWWLEIYTDVGTTAVNYTVTYTSGAGTPAQTTAQYEQIGSTTASRNRASRLIPIIAANGDTIRIVESIQLAASTGSAGSFGVTATRRIADIPLGLANAGTTADWAQTGLPLVPDNACLMLAVVPATTTTGTLLGTCTVIEA